MSLELTYLCIVTMALLTVSKDILFVSQGYAFDTEAYAGDILPFPIPRADISAVVGFRCFDVADHTACR
jgi:hypothetical protein